MYTPPIEIQLQKDAKQLQEINVEISQLKESIQAKNNPPPAQIPAVMPSTPAPYALSEISALIHLSALQLEHARDPQSASRLLTLADKIIESLHDTRFEGLREAIITERLALEAIRLPDTEGVWLKLGALMAETEQLPSCWTPLNQDETKQNSAPKQTSISNPPTSHWQKAWDSGWHELKDFIKIQHHDKAIAPLLSAEEQVFYKQYVHLLLEQARWAVINVKPMIYKASLEEAQQWLTRYFNTDDNRVKNAINTLKDLEKVNLIVVFPPLDQTLNQLDQLEKKTLSNNGQP